MAPDLPSQSTLRQQIANTARDLATRYRDSAYQLGGKSTTSMDCSYFVYLVFHEVFPDFDYLSSELISTRSDRFRESKAARPGDVIFFPRGQNPYEVQRGNKREFPNHVGIVIDEKGWVGRQTSSLGLVKMANPWWGARAKRFFSYVGFGSEERASVRSSPVQDAI